MARYKVLADMRDFETSTIMAPERTMRLTRQSRYSARNAAGLAGRARKGPLLWEQGYYRGKKV